MRDRAVAEHVQAVQADALVIYLPGAFAQRQVVGVTMANHVQRIHDPGSS